MQFVDGDKVCEDGDKVCVDGDKVCVDDDKVCVDGNKVCEDGDGATPLHGAAGAGCPWACRRSGTLLGSVCT